MNIVACVAAVEVCGDRKSRIIEINKILAGNADASTKAGKDLLHQRALFVTELRKKELVP